jgi:uncharacterized alkaline shock family protein YloU
MDLVAARHAERLPCGAEVAALLDQVTQGREAERSSHQAACPYCQALLPELGRLWAPVRRLASEQVVVPPAVLAAVMRRVRALVAAAWLGLRTGTRGTTRVAHWVVAKLASLAAREVPGVHQALSRVTPPTPGRPRDEAASPGGDGTVEAGTGQAAIDLRLVATYGDPLPHVADAVRANVIRRIRQLTGLQITQVNITVDDLHTNRPQ